MNIRPIRSNADHEQALLQLTSLLEQDPAPDSDEGAELDLLATLIEKYEADRFPIELPTPLEAIRFRMDQLGLRNKDLVPCLGSASKVSEVLNGKRPLSLSMIRALHDDLGIPAEVLIKDPDASAGAAGDLNPGDYPAREMHRRGYFSNAPASWPEAKKRLGSLLPKFLRDAGVREASPAYCRSTAHYRQGKTLKPEALEAWQARILLRSRQRHTARYEPGTIDQAFLARMADLSILEEGPRLAREMLEKHGIAVVVERHLPQTYLDGAAFLRDDGAPVIGLTLRHDKLDNFWFTLLHELAHAGWHLAAERTAIFDDIGESATDEIEREADAIAAEALIPETEWRGANLARNAAPAAVASFARRLNRHPAIVVGRLQRELGNCRLLAGSPGVGRGKVRRQFEDF